MLIYAPVMYDDECMGHTGVLLKYLQQQFEALKAAGGDFSPSSSGLYQQKNLVGIDLSSEMINICRATYPQATFHHGDFLDYKGLPPSQQTVDVDTTNHSESSGLFDAVVFNECLHNFRDIESTLVHALSLMRLNGCVIVSHPRGFDNVFMQAGKNKWLCPSLLPSNKGNQPLMTILFYPPYPLLYPTLPYPTLFALTTPYLTSSCLTKEWEDLATRFGAEAVLVPSIKSAHYLGVMVKRK